MNKKNKFDKEQFCVTIIFLIIAITLIVISIIKIVKNNNLDAANSYTTILLLISFCYIVYRAIKNRKLIPINIKGENLPVKNDKKSKRIRLKSYFIESLIFSILVVFLDLIVILFFKESASMFYFKGLSNLSNIILNSFITFLISYLISFLFEYLIGEIFVKPIKKNK